jgi:hypothetical protein
LFTQIPGSVARVKTPFRPLTNGNVGRLTYQSHHGKLLVQGGTAIAFVDVGQNHFSWCNPRQLFAEAIGRQTGMPARSLTPEEAEDHFGPLAMWVGNNGPVSNKWTRDTLGWTPTHLGIVADIERPDYSPAAMAK